MEKNLARRHAGEGLNSSETSIAKLLARHGYATALYGKWHLGFEPKQGPNAHGFQDFFGFHDWSIDYYSHRNIHGDRALHENAKLVDREGYLTGLITDRATAFIDNNAQRLFFLYVAYSSALPPYQIPGHPKDVRTEDNWQHGTREDYAGMVESMDTGIGRILGVLKDNEIADRTLVIYTHDHGGEWLSRNEPFFHGFGTLWEGGIHVPCLIRWPGRIPAGTVSEQVAISMDLSATILAAAGISTPPEEQFDGIDLLPILACKGEPVARTLFWRLNHSGREQKAVRQGKWKYIIDEWNELLFDLDADPSERRDMSYRRPDVRQSLRAALEKWERELN